MPKSPKSDQNDFRTTRVGHNNIGYCALLAGLPLLAALLPQIWVFLLVPRDDIAEYIPKLPSTHDAFSPPVISSLYIYAVAASCTVVIACASLWYSGTTLMETSADKNGRLPGHIKFLLVLAFAAACLSFLPYVIDDQTTAWIFNQSGIASHRPSSLGHVSPLSFDWDGRVLGFVVYLAFLVAAVASAAAATSAPLAQTSHPSKPNPAGPAARRMKILSFILFLTAGVLLAAMVTAKLRFDVALATFGSPEKAMHDDYAVITRAITSYWSVVLSLALAALYVPPALSLYPPYLWERSDEPVPWFNTENIMRVLRLVAIASPPLVAQVIKGIAS